MKNCIKCNIQKPLSEFYKHAQMADGHLNKCKDCAKCESIKNRLKNIDFYREYDKKRGCRKSSENQIKNRLSFPNQYRAQNLINNAIRSKKLFKEPCEVCGSEKVHAHHDDYLKPLNIRWLCAEHHKQWHTINGNAKHR